MNARALGGVVGPLALVSGWAVLGQRTPGHSHVTQPMSSLAAVGAPTRVAFTGALLGYAAGVGAYARALGDALPSGHARTAVAVNAVATASVAATPVGTAVGGTPHAVAAGSAYLSLMAVPLLAARSLAADGRRGLAAASNVAAAATGAGLVLSLADPNRTGLWQRAGLTVGHAWMAASAVAVLATRRR